MAMTTAMAEETTAALIDRFQVGEPDNAPVQSSYRSPVPALKVVGREGAQRKADEWESLQVALSR